MLLLNVEINFDLIFDNLLAAADSYIFLTSTGCSEAGVSHTVRTGYTYLSGGHTFETIDLRWM